MSADDRSVFETEIAPFRRELHAHCYRMLGSLQDADDALQDALIGAWRGRAGFEGRSALRTWLYTIATHACLRLIAERPKRLLAEDVSPAGAPDAELGAMRLEPMWVEPYPDDPGARLEQREGIELAFVAALQHLPGSQRAALILREVMGFEAAEVAEALGTSVASINSALQRARQAVDTRVPPRSQQSTLRALGDDGQRALVTSYVEAWQRRDVDALVALLAHDARFTMPPIPSWFEGHRDVGRFFAERVFATAWRLYPTIASGQLAFACYQGPDFRLGALNVLTLQGDRIIQMTGFLDPTVHARFSLRPTDEFLRAARSEGA